MFGIIRPCRNRLGEELRASWMAHLCGMCLALRDQHGQLSRLVTNYDAVVISALVEAQTGSAGRRRQAGPCPLRGMRTASVAAGGGAQLAAAVSLLLASAKLSDHVADGDIDGALRVRAAQAMAARWERAGRDTGAALELDGGVLLDVVAQQRSLEVAPVSILDVTAPTETATALAFRHTAVVAGRPGNADALAEAGRLFGRLAHLLDAVEDVHTDRTAGRWNPISALGLRPTDVRTLCDDALLGVRLALRDVAFVDGRLVHLLLVHELQTAIERTFVAAGQPAQPPLTPPLPPDQQPPDQQPPDQQPPGWGPESPPAGWEAPDSPAKHGPLRGCLGWLVVCGTCQVCCAGDYVDPCTGRPRSGCLRGTNCSDCGDCCNCGDCCCDCGDCCDC